MVDKRTDQQGRISIITPARIKLSPPALALWGLLAPSRAAFPAVFSMVLDMFNNVAVETTE